MKAASSDPEALTRMLTRLKLTAIRDQLDTLLDTATRRKLTLVDTVQLLCEAEVARKYERRIQLASSIAKLTVQTVGKCRGRFVEQRLDGLLDAPRPGQPLH